MSREELLLKKKEDVVTIAKENGITLTHSNKRKTKEQLVDEILSKTEEQKTEKSVNNDDEEWQQPNDETEKSESAELEEKTENDISTELTEEQKAEKEKKKKAYIESVKIGTLVAFTSYTGKVKSAKVTKRSTKNRKLKVETKYGAEFIISYDDVIWVRTNKRWPKGVYQLLKGVVDNEEVEE